MQKHMRFNVAYLAFALVAIVMLQQWWREAQTLEVVPYSEFENLLAQGRIAEVAVGERQIVGRLKTPENGKSQVIANRVESGVADRLSRYGVPYSQLHEGTLLRDLFSWVVPALVFFGVWYLLARRMTSQSGGLGGLMSIGKSRAKVYVERETGVTFADVAGVDEAKAELQEVVEFLRDRRRPVPRFSSEARINLHAINTPRGDRYTDSHLQRHARQRELQHVWRMSG